MTEWVTKALPEVLDFREGPGILAVDFRDSGVPLLRLAGLKPGASLLDGCNYLDAAKVDRKWSHFRVEAGDVLLSTSASLGEVAVVNESAVGAIPYTGIIRFRPNGDKVSPRFIRFLLTDPSFKRQIEAMGVGSVMRHFGPSHLRHMTVTFPPVADQDCIADVLGALDDKIAANQLAAATAVRLADALFASATREVEGSSCTFADVAEIGGGGTPSTKIETYWNGGIPWATPTDVTALEGPYLQRTARMITEAGLSACSSTLYPAGSILMTSRATIGAFAVAEVPTAVNQGFIVVNARSPESQMWLFHEMRSRVDEFISLANGATFLELSRGRFKALPVRLANKEVIRGFGKQASVIHQKAAHALEESRSLASLRDTLLPALMSGKIRVRDAEKSVEAAI